MIIRRVLSEMTENNHFQSESGGAISSMVNSTNSSVSVKPAKSDRSMRKLWALMTDAFGHRWTSVHGEYDLGGTWARGLAGLTGADIAMGMARVVDSGADWPPGLPEFRALCKPTPDQIGAPSVARAYAEACRNAHPAATRVWSHPTVHHAAMNLGFRVLSGQSESVALPRFERLYLEAVRLVFAGEALLPMPEPEVLALAKLPDPEVVKSHIAGLRELLGQRKPLGVCS